jgi:hypothetical protein
MRLRNVLRSPLVLPLAFAASMAAWLGTRISHAIPQTQDQQVVWVYEVAICASPGDPSDCRLLDRDRAPTFGSRDACATFLNADLARAGDPRRMGSCLHFREA